MIARPASTTSTPMPALVPPVRWGLWDGEIVLLTGGDLDEVGRVVVGNAEAAATVDDVAEVVSIAGADTGVNDLRSADAHATAMVCAGAVNRSVDKTVGLDIMTAVGAVIRSSHALVGWMHVMFLCHKSGATFPPQKPEGR